MKRLFATTAIAAAVALAGCGGTQHPGQASADAQCAHWKAAAQSFAQNYVSDLPTPPSQSTVDRLAATSYQADAASHGLACN